MTETLRDQLQDTLGDAYTLERELGGGGMSRVFVATERSLGRRVVIKVLAPELAAEVSGPRFTREIRLTANLQHPQIVPVLSAGESGGQPYYIMPFVEGESLRAYVTRLGALPIAGAVSILRDVAKALEYAHARGVVHRDIKPDNVLLVGSSATVADFGIAKAISASATDAGHAITQQGTAIGTPAYMAPEQAAGDPNVDHRADLYAFGAMAYEILTGESPFAGRPGHQMVVAHMTEQPVPLGDRRSDIPPALAALVRRCLEKDREARPQSATEIVLALDAVSTPTGGVARAAHAAPRARWIAWGIAAAVVVLASIGAWAAARRGGGVGAALDDREVRSVAVLPFENVGGDTATEYFSEGVTGELIAALTKVPGLRVTPRASAFALRAKGLDVKQIGERLHVGTVVSGSIRRLGSSVRVTAELVDVHDERTLWAGTFDGALQSVFAVQDSITRAVVGKLRVRLTDSTTRARSRQPADTTTYLLYLKGRYSWNKRTAASMRLGTSFLEQAIARDSTYAPAWAELASAYSLMPAFGDITPNDVVPRARSAASHAIALDSTLAEAHIAMGIINTFYDRDFPAAERQLTTALALAPNDANAHLFHTWSLLAVGRFDDALTEIRTAQRLDPFAPIINTRLGSMLYYVRRYSESVDELRKTIEIDSTNVLARFELGNSLARLKRYDEAFATFPTMRGFAAGWEEGRMAVAYGDAGRRADAQRILGELQSRSKTTYVTTEAIAAATLAVGDKDGALALLDRAVTEHSFYLVFLGCDPHWDALHQDARFSALVKRVGVAPWKPGASRGAP